MSNVVQWLIVILLAVIIFMLYTIAGNLRGISEALWDISVNISNLYGQ